MATEDRDPRFLDLDRWTSAQAITAMVEGQMGAVAAVAAVAPALSAAADAAAERLRGGAGRIVYAGAGTSGRVAVQDGVELVPTFGWPWERLAFAMAGGQTALMQAVENSEDDRGAGVAFAQDHDIGPTDVVVGVAASGRTPYTLGLVESARAAGALVIGVANNPETALLSAAHHAIFLETGPEPVTGSTRMRAGTAQKVALNVWSTAVMVRLGGVYKGLMVGMRATNAKLRSRSVRIVMTLSGASESEARLALAETNGEIKPAILAALGIDTATERDAMLGSARGDLRVALSALLED